MSVKFSRAKLCVLFLFATLAWAVEDHDGKKKSPSDPGARRPPKTGGTSQESEGCAIDPSDLASVANGEASNLTPVIIYLTAPGCTSNRVQIARSAIAKGIQFNQMPFRLDQMAKTYSLTSLQSAKQLDTLLRRMVPTILEEHPLTVQEQVPLVAQFSLLSQSTGTWALGNLIKDELIATATTLSGKGKEIKSEDLAKNLVQMGATENVIVSELVDMVEEMAVLSQADGLGKVLKGLASAASVEGALVPVFNAAANAFQRGVEKGKKEFSTDQTRNLTSAGLEGAKEAIQGNSLLNAGVSDLNEAFKALLDGKPVNILSLRSLWQEIVKALAVTPLLPNLAEMIAASITPQVTYLPERSRRHVLLAAKNYPPIAFALEKNLLKAWNESWDALHSGEISTYVFNEKREKFFKPLVNELLENDTIALDDSWLHAVLRRGLVKDDLIEKRFPAFVLTLFERRDKALQTMNQAPELETALQNFSENLSVLWSLSHVYIPALRKWVIKYDE